MITEHTKLKVAVLTGGISTEREISLQSGRCIGGALEQAGIDVVLADVTPDILEILDDTSIDVFFIAIHGQFGEDGQLQQILEDRRLAYTGSGPTANRLAMDKLASKRAFARAGVAVPDAIEFDHKLNAGELENKLKHFADAYVVKPVTQGSSVGVTIVYDPRQVIPEARKCRREFGDCMIERFVPGREVTVGILSGKALPVIEIRPAEKFYNYHAKYLDEQTEYLFATIENPAIEADIKTKALACFEALGCRHFGRVDFIVSDDGLAHALEVNTIPGFTTHSCLPKAAERAGIPMSRLCVKIVEAALNIHSSDRIRLDSSVRLHG